MTPNDTHPMVPHHLGPNDVIASFRCTVIFFFICFFFCKLTNFSFTRLYFPRNEELTQNDTMPTPPRHDPTPTLPRHNGTPPTLSLMQTVMRDVTGSRQHTTRPQPYEQLLVGWLVGGSCSWGGTKQRRRVGNDTGTGNTVDIRSRVGVPDCRTRTTPYPFPRCYGYASKYRDSSHVTLLIFDMLIVGYTFVYNDVHDPSNTPPSPQKRDGGLWTGQDGGMTG